MRCWVEGLSELSIGGASDAIELGARAYARFSAGMHAGVNGAASRIAIPCRWQAFSALHSAGALQLGGGADDRWLIGHAVGAWYALTGYSRQGADARLSLYRASGTSIHSAGAALDTALQIGLHAVIYSPLPATGIAQATNALGTNNYTAAGIGAPGSLSAVTYLEAQNASCVLSSVGPSR